MINSNLDFAMHKTENEKFYNKSLKFKTYKSNEANFKLL